MVLKHHLNSSKEEWISNLSWYSWTVFSLNLCRHTSPTFVWQVENSIFKSQNNCHKFSRQEILSTNNPNKKTTHYKKKWKASYHGTRRAGKDLSNRSRVRIAESGSSFIWALVLLFCFVAGVKGRSPFKKTVKKGDIVPFWRPPP